MIPLNFIKSSFAFLPHTPLPLLSLLCRLTRTPTHEHSVPCVSCRALCTRCPHTPLLPATRSEHSLCPVLLLCLCCCCVSCGTPAPRPARCCPCSSPLPRTHDCVCVVFLLFVCSILSPNHINSWLFRAIGRIGIILFFLTYSISIPYFKLYYYCFE